MRFSRAKTHLRRPRPLLVLSALLVLVCVATIPTGASSPTGLPAAATPRPPAPGSALAIVRSGGAGQYDASGKLLSTLPAGATVDVVGRSADSQWLYGTSRDPAPGAAPGWMPAASLLVFNAGQLPVREGFTAPTSSASPAPANPAQPAATAAPAVPAQVPAAAETRGLPAQVVSGTVRLNVRSGPGATFPVVDTLAPGTTVTLLARNETADWAQLARPASGGSTGWISASLLTVQGEGDLRTLPVAGPPSAAATQAPAQAQTAATQAPDAPVSGLAGKLVFQDRSGGTIHIYDLAGGTLRPLTTGADPAITRDGRTVAFWRDTGQHGLYTIGSDGHGERAILTRGEPLRAPSWRPDGQRLVFTHVVGQDRCRDAGYGICLPDTRPYSFVLPLVLHDLWGLASVDADGQGYQDLAAGLNAIEPAWAERGIAYAARGIGLAQDTSDTGLDRKLLGEYRYQDPALQPNGESIIYQSQEKDHWEIFAVNADGSGRTALTRPATTLVDRLPNNVAPAWSPDGRHIVFLSDRSGKWQLWVMDANGANQRPLPVDVPIEYNYQAEQVVSWGQ